MEYAEAAAKDDAGDEGVNEASNPFSGMLTCRCIIIDNTKIK